MSVLYIHVSFFQIYLLQKLENKLRQCIPCIISYCLSLLDKNLYCQGRRKNILALQFGSVAQPYLTLRPDCSTPGLPVLHQLPELAQTHVHRVSDAIHLILCHSLLLLPSIFPSIRVFSKESLHQVAKVLEGQLQHQSFQ